MASFTSVIDPQGLTLVFVHLLREPRSPLAMMVVDEPDHSSTQYFERDRRPGYSAQVAPENGAVPGKPASCYLCDDVTPGYATETICQ